MELNINLPAQFNKTYGIDDEVYKFCQKLYLFFKDKEYSDKLHIIGIVIDIVPKEISENDVWCESCKLINYKSCAIINMGIDFNLYLASDIKQRIMLVEKMILKAVETIKSKVNFDINEFKEDLSKINM